MLVQSTQLRLTISDIEMIETGLRERAARLVAERRAKLDAEAITNINEISDINDQLAVIEDLLGRLVTQKSK